MTLFEEQCNRARAIFAKHCAQPLPSDIYDRQRWIMCGIHTGIVDSLQNAYIRADHVSPSEEEAFVRYCFFATQNLEQHHRLEEDHVFPLLEPEFHTDVNQEHAAFSSAFNSLEQYTMQILGIRKGAKFGTPIPNPEIVKVEYDAQQLKKHIEALAVPLLLYLEHEIEWLAPENIRNSGITVERLQQVHRVVQRHILGALVCPCQAVAKTSSKQHHGS